MKKRNLLIITIILVSIINLVIPNNVNAITNNVKWSKTPVVLYATSQLNDIEILALKSAIIQWNNLERGMFFIYGGQLKSKIVGIDGINTIGKAHIKSFSTIANTNTCFLKGNDKMLEADIVLDFNINYEKYNLKNIFMHELGHVVGLADNDEYSSIMYRYYNNNSSISDYDILDIENLYI